MNSGIVIYPRTISTADALKILIGKTDNAVIYTNSKDIQNELQEYNIEKYPVRNNNDIIILDDISYVEPNIQTNKLFIMASWGATKQELSLVLENYPKLYLYRLGEIQDILPLYVCEHKRNQLFTCLAKYSHTKQVTCARTNHNPIINGFRINNIKEFNKEKKGLYIANNNPISLSGIEHLHMVDNVNINNIKQWLNKVYLRSNYSAGSAEKMIVHIYGKNLNSIIDEINSLDYIYGEIWKRGRPV